MKVIRIGARGAEHPALLGVDGTVLDLSGLTADIVELVINGLGVQTPIFAEA